MRIWILMLCAQSAIAREPPPFGATRPPPEQPVIESKTPEGLTVWVAPRAGLPKASVVLALRAGAVADEPALEGMTELLAYTVAEGTRTRSAQKIAEDMQAVGAELAADWNADAIFLSANGLSSGADRMIEVIADVARNPRFPDEEVALVKDNLVALLGERESTAEFIGDRAFARALFGAHPYHITHATRAVLAQVTPEILRREHSRRFRPDRALLLVAGDVDPKAVAKAASSAFGGWKASGAPLPPLSSPSASAQRRIILVDRPESVQSHIIVGRMAPPESEPGYWSALIGNTIFGGMSSARVTRRLREEKGWSYSPASSMMPLQRAAVMELVADVRTEVTAPALREALAELDKMRSLPPTEEELARARRYLSGLYLVRNQSVEALADTLARNWVLGLPPDSLWRYMTRLDSVTLDEVKRAAEALFPPATQTVVVVGDAARVAKELAGFGAISVEKP